MNQSSIGNAAPKSRSIDVGANLLSEWISEQLQLRDQILRLGVVIAASSLVAAVLTPALWKSGTSDASQAGELKSAIAELDAQLLITDKARKEAQPLLVVNQMCERTRNYFDFSLDQIGQILRGGNPRMVLSSLHCSVTAAESHTVVQGFAEDEGAANAFARSVSQEGSKIDTIISSRPSPLLAPNGLSFEYEKRIVVPK